MADKARVTSLEALDEFRSSLIVYLSKARPALEEVDDEVMRTRVWVQSNQITHWEHQVRRRALALEQAQQALFSAGISKLRQVSDAERMAVQRAKHALQEAEDKLRRVKQWSREFETRVEPLAKQLDQLRNVLTIDMPKAAAHLAGLIKSLSEYANLAPPPLDAPAAPPAEADAAPTTPEPPAAGGAA
jgi:chromosome segregation ATPase